MKPLSTRTPQEVRRIRSQVLLIVFMLLVAFDIGVAQDMPAASILRFTDAPDDTQREVQLTSFQPLPEHLSKLDAPLSPADTWLKQHGWERVWPKWPFGSTQKLSFSGATTQRYLRLEADQAHYIWSRPVNLDPHHLPFLNITWGVDRFPHEAALDIMGRNDRPIVILVSFGPKVPSPGLLPDIPRALAFFWDETATVGGNYTCISPHGGPEDVRMQCTYPHVKYIALRRGGSGSVHTDQVNLLDHFRQYFPDYWQQHQHVPPIVAVSFEARSDRTASHSLARLYRLAFTADAPPYHTAW